MGHNDKVESKKKENGTTWVTTFLGQRAQNIDHRTPSSCVIVWKDLDS